MHGPHHVANQSVTTSFPADCIFVSSSSELTICTLPVAGPFGVSFGGGAFWFGVFGAGVVSFPHVFTAPVMANCNCSNVSGLNDADSVLFAAFVTAIQAKTTSKDLKSNMRREVAVDKFREKMLNLVILEIE